jgi:hypothetical protein
MGGTILYTLERTSFRDMLETAMVVVEFVVFGVRYLGVRCEMWMKLVQKVN